MGACIGYSKCVCVCVFVLLLVIFELLIIIVIITCFLVWERAKVIVDVCVSSVFLLLVIFERFLKFRRYILVSVLLLVRRLWLSVKCVVSLE